MIGLKTKYDCAGKDQQQITALLSLILLTIPLLLLRALPRNGSTSHNILNFVTSVPFFYMLSVACGSYHTVIVTQKGEVYTCGSNDHGQLGHEKPCKKPGKFL
jgi:alpha-tubulin suppressor-like RCC1 family protein